MKTKHLKSFLNYTGSKHEILPQILPLFHNEYDRFIDLFCGSGTVAINEAIIQKKHDIEYFLNDINKPVMNILTTLWKLGAENFLQLADKIIIEYNLSNTSKYGYSYYNVDSSTGLSKINRESFMSLRNDFNANKFYGDKKSIVLYVLIVYSFNNQVRFNKKGEYNLPVGKRDLNKSMRLKLASIAKVLKTYNFYFTMHDFYDFHFKKADFVYCDPPYLIGLATYNENGLWTVNHERKLLTLLDKLNEKGIKFALSNVLQHKGNENFILKEWAKNYKTYYIKKNYKNSNYQSKASLEHTQEVLVINY